MEEVAVAPVEEKAVLAPLPSTVLAVAP